MNKQGPIQNFWTERDALVVWCYNAIMILPWLVAVIFGKVSREAINQLAENESLLPFSFWIFSLLPIALTSWLVLNRRKESGCSLKQLLGLPSKDKLFSSIKAGLLCGVVLFFLAFIVMQYWSPFLNSFGVEAPSQYLIDVLRSGLLPYWQIAGIGVLVVIFAPIVEEILYRGILYGELRKRNNKFVAVLLISVYFAVIHTNLFALPGVFLVGIGLTLVYDQPLLGKEQSSCGRVGLIGSMCAHLAFNLLNLIATICISY